MQPEKACSPIDVTLFGILIEVRSVQPEKAQDPIEVTLFGISIEVRPVQPKKALDPIDVTLLGILVVCQPAMSSLASVFIIALQSSLESYTEFPSFTTIEIRPVPPPKADLTIEVTLLGISTEVRPVQP